MPDDPIELVVFVVDPPPVSNLAWERILMEVEDRRNCSAPEKGLTEMKTVADLVAIIKSAPEQVPPTPQEKAKFRWRKIGCLTIFGIIAIVILYLMIKK